MVGPPITSLEEEETCLWMLITENQLKSSSLRSSLMQCPRYLYLVTFVNNTLFNTKFGIRISWC